jgi:hypothetical protein
MDFPASKSLEADSLFWFIRLFWFVLFNRIDEPDQLNHPTIPASRSSYAVGLFGKAASG